MREEKPPIRYPRYLQVQLDSPPHGQFYLKLSWSGWEFLYNGILFWTAQTVCESTYLAFGSPQMLTPLFSPYTEMTADFFSCLADKSSFSPLAVGCWEKPTSMPATLTHNPESVESGLLVAPLFLWSSAWVFRVACFRRPTFHTPGHAGQRE